MPKGEKLYNIQPPETKPGEIARDTELVLQLASVPSIDIKDAEQIKNRCEWYFNFCTANDVRPTITGLCLSLGCVRQSLINWENENSQRGEVIRKAKSVIRVLLETWSVSGKLSPPIAIFWGKNFLDMSDTVKIEAVNNTGMMQADKTPEEIERQIIAEIPVDDPEE